MHFAWNRRTLVIAAAALFMVFGQPKTSVWMNDTLRSSLQPEGFGWRDGIACYRNRRAVAGQLLSAEHFLKNRSSWGAIPASQYL
jgi:hypothetical protein